MPRCYAGASLLLILYSLFAPFASGKDELLAWLEGCGGRLSPKLHLDDVLGGSGERGLFIVEDLEADDVAVSVPVGCVISTEMAQNTSMFAPSIEAAIANNTSAHILTLGVFWQAVFMMEHAENAESPFAAYLHNLAEYFPKVKDSLPLFWPEGRFEDDLRGTRTLREIRLLRSRSADEFALIAAAELETAARFTLEQYRVARAWASSRSFNMRGSQGAMVPVVDMANHFLPAPDLRLSSPIDVSRHEAVRIDNQVGVREGGKDEALHMQLWASRGQAAGGEMTITYGLRDNSHYLCSYGFTVPWIHRLTCLATTNLVFPLASLPSTPRSSDRLPLLEELVDREGGGLLFEVDGCGGEKMEAALAFARFWHADGSPEDLRFRCSLGAPKPLGKRKVWSLTRPECKFLSAAGEAAALRLIREAAARSLEGMSGGSLKDDEALLAEGSLRGSALAVVTVRSDEKWVLEQVVTLMSKGIEGQRGLSVSERKTYISDLAWELEVEIMEKSFEL